MAAVQYFSTLRPKETLVRSRCLKCRYKEATTGEGAEDSWSIIIIIMMRRIVVIIIMMRRIAGMILMRIVNSIVVIIGVVSSEEIDAH